MTQHAAPLCTRLKFLLLSTALLVAFPAPSYAQDYLLDSNVKIERHNKRTTNVQFPRDAKKYPLDQWGLMFERSSEGATTPDEANLIHYESLPTCEKSEVRLLEIYHHTAGTDSNDVLYYSVANQTQARRAEKYQGFKIAYQPALMRNPKTGHPDYWQAFARFIQIDCLPVRFHFTYIGSVRYMEYRTGEEAWKAGTSSK